ncbi:MAG: CBS domain-containing protein [Rhodospirillales bacterium]|nr:CBS domain-containing protein [Alphaproteobacteria bacterium]USO04267.1 MAG: CBS domain-containing protein [Rhodospirillales bacterium]
MSERKKYIQVREVMTPEIETIDGLASIAEAIVHMKEKHYGALIVNKRDESDEYGFVTVQGIAREVIEKNLSPERVHVYEIMRKPVLTVHGDMNIRYAIRLLEQVNQGRALVIDNGKAVGIVTVYDMVIHYMDN